METLHLDYKTPPIFEYLRQKLANRGFWSDFLKTYQIQRLNFPDRNSGLFWDEVFSHQTSLMPMEVWRINKVISLLDGKKNLLNIGVGKGALETFLFRKFPDIEYRGTDFTRFTLDLLQQKYGKSRIKFNTLPHLKFRRSTFDQILFLEVIEHIKPQMAFAVFSEIYRVLKPEGKLIVSVPINEHLDKLIPYNPNSHMRMYSEEVIRSELRLSGFTIEKVYRTSAFHKFFKLKHLINQLLLLREYNNLIILARKV